jgi:hypothetical protein
MLVVALLSLLLSADWVCTPEKTTPPLPAASYGVLRVRDAAGLKQALESDPQTSRENSMSAGGETVSLAPDSLFCPSSTLVTVPKAVGIVVRSDDWNRGPETCDFELSELRSGDVAG